LSDLKTSNILANSEVNVKKSYGKKNRDQLLDQANTLPKKSGCYFMLGRHGEIIYVGKAKSLKSRVTSYFNASAKSPKTQLLVEQISNFDFILTYSDAESFVLENNLIKKHRPKYNIQLKDDKSYPYVTINLKEKFPRLEYMRRPKRKQQQELFGPFPVGSNISSILKILTKVFSLRDCSLHDFNTRKTPCILYQMKQCSAPCTEEITQDNYRKDLELATNFFKTNKKVKATLEFLTLKMMKCAQDELFEQAASLRDDIEVLDAFAQKSFEQTVENLSDSNIDVISYYVGADEIDISIYMIRQGNLLGHKSFHFLKADFLKEIEEEIIGAILQYYSSLEEVIPEKIITDFTKDASEQLGLAIKKMLGQDLKLQVQSHSKKYARLLKSVNTHAQETQSVRIQNHSSVFIGLEKLQDLLSLKERPKILECYDVAVWQGKSPTASQIVFYEGRPDKKQYRYFHLTELPEGNNDFEMMREVFYRRLKYGNLPDVFIVDGGVQQVNTVKKVLDELEIEVPVVGIAKARDLKKSGYRSSEIKRSEERLVIQGRSNPFVLNKCWSLMRIVVNMRDEAHRFSRKLHHKAEHKRIIHSWVDEIKGLNKTVKQDILKKNTHTLPELQKLSLEQLQDTLELESKHAKLIHKYFHGIDRS
jgi:excinuclease ABC subunit C